MIHYVLTKMCKSVEIELKIRSYEGFIEFMELDRILIE